MLSWEIAGMVVGVCAGASFFCALAESALFSLGRWRVQELGEASPQGQRLRALLKEPQELLAAIVLGNTFANAAMVAAVLWVLLRERLPVVVPMAGLCLFILLVCEVLPKALGVRGAAFWALKLAEPAEVLLRFTRPVRRLANAIQRLVLWMIPKSVKPQPFLSDPEYQDLLEIACQQGTLAASEKEIILQIIRLDRRTVGEVMKPRARMACIRDDLSVEEMVEAARKHRHSRLPMYDETPDTIVGILNTRLLLLDPSVDLSEVMEFPSFVPSSMNLLQLFQSLQKQKRGLAIVLDEFGGTAGLVTTQDILEEVLGQFRKKGPAGGVFMERQGRGKWRVSGTMRIEDFRREHPALGEVAEADTMGGWLVHGLEVVPAAGQGMVLGGLRLTALVVDEQRVREVLVEVAA